jgi:hypothetical protein
MAILDLIGAARDDEFSARVAMCLMVASINIANEDTATLNHPNRIAFAYRFFKGEINSKVVAAAVIATNATVQGTINANPAGLGADVPDADLQFVVNGIIDHFANAYAAAGTATA